MSPNRLLDVGNPDKGKEVGTFVKFGRYFLVYACIDIDVCMNVWTLSGIGSHTR